MKKTILALTAVAMTIAATPAFAGNLQGEVRFGDVRGGTRGDSTEYRVQYDAPLNSFLNYGLELQAAQNNDEGPLSSKVSAKLGPKVPAILGFQPSVTGEIGRSLAQGNNFEFWGASVKVSRPLFGPVSANLGYRHREGFAAADVMNENRINGGLTYDIGSGNAIGVTYYRTTGTKRIDQVGVGVSHKF